MKPKFRMTRDESLFVMRRNMVDYIWKSAKLKDLGVTYADTEAIFIGMRAPNVKVEEIVAVNNLKHAWRFLLDNLDAPLDCLYVCHLNKIVGGDNIDTNAGFIRSVPVSVSGTSWKPDMPIELQIKEEMADISTIEEPTDRAITMMLYLMRKQMFLDGNNRTSMLAGNQIMIANGYGVFSVPIELQPEFTKLLVEYYESGDMEELKQFVYDNCIDGIDFRQNEVVENDEPDESSSPKFTM